MKQFYARGKKCYPYHLLIILYYRDKMKVLLLMLTIISSLNATFFVVEISVKGMDTQ